MLVLPVAAALLLLIRGRRRRQGDSLFYLASPFTALLARALFGEAMVPVEIVGMAVAADGVALATRG